MRIIFGADHRGVDFRDYLAGYLQDHDRIDTVTVGAESAAESVDYPNVVKETIEQLRLQGDFGVLICGSGNGVAMAANRYPGIRAAVCRSILEAEMARLHNNAQILCIGSDFSSETDSLAMIRRFVSTEFEGGRHQRRIDLMDSLSR